jgi:hypothetical protein
LGLAAAVVKTRPKPQFLKGTNMVNFPDAEGGHDSNFPAHVRNYLGFMTLLKWSVIVSAITTAIVLYVISN